MKKLCIFALLPCILAAEVSHAQMSIGDSTIVSFASVDKAREILTARDDFVRCMSPFDRAARMKTDSDISEEDYLAFVGKNVLAWDDAEKQKITSAFQGIHAGLESLSLPFPKKVFIVKTTGNEEGGAAYTRANAIVIPKIYLDAPIAKIQKAICHELFHIMSRANPELREKLYTIIGFVKCGEVEFPEVLISRKITNPDAPKNDHCIRLQVEGKPHWVIPILFSATEKYDIARGGEFFNYLQFQFLLIHRDNSSLTVKAIYNGRKPKLVGMKHVSGFFEQAGKNTGYIIHPEEILADNFVLLVLAEKNIRSPKILDKMRKILAGKRIAEQKNAHDKK